jgi:hypothetical protein
VKKKILFLLTFFIPLLAMSQTGQTGTVRGVIRDDAGQVIPNAPVKIKGTSIESKTDSTGAYELKNVPYGNSIVIVGDENNFNASENIEVKQAESTVNISARGGLESINAGSNEIPSISFGDDEVKESATSGVSSVLSSSRDVYNSAANFVFSVSRFRIRGYDSDNFPTLMNGAIVTDISNGRSEFSAWSGLNDVVRTRENSHGLAPANYSFGGVGGVSSIDSRASQQRKQFQVSYAASNRTYDNRIVITYGSGVSAKGWSYCLSYSRRWADEGYTPGTFYDGNSFFGSVEKQINLKHSLSLTAFGAKTISGRSSYNVQEMFNLAGTHYYNSYWGYQNGEKRNAVVGDNFQPIVILTHDWQISEKSSLETALSFQTGKNKLSGIDWYKAEDPRPDYYRYLPSWDPSKDPITGAHSLTYNEDSTELANYLSQNEAARQINWDKIYEANEIHDTANYVISERVIDAKRYGFNTIYNNDLTNNIALSGGLSYQRQDISYYKELKDLLGGNYFVNLNQFSDLTTLTNPDVIQNDLNNPNQKIYEGDRYGYDYVAHLGTGTLWGQSVFKYDHIDLFVAASVTRTDYYRTGNVKNGVFATTSYGDSKTYSFTEPSFKGGITYKLNGRNYFYVNGAYIMRPPLFENTFISPRTRDLAVTDPKSETISSVEGGYIYRAPRLKARATGYFTQFTDQTDVKSFYHDDLKTFVNYTLTGIDKSHAGIELAVDASLGHGFSAVAVASIGQYIYTDRPSAMVTQDNKDTILATNETVYIKNIHVSGGPQTAYTLGFNYRSKKYWFLNVNFNYFDNMYTDVNPVRRTLPALEYVDAGSATWENILGQEKLDGQFTMDVSGGWSWKFDNKIKGLKKNAYLVLNLGVSNLLNNKDLTLGSFEQLRYDFVNHDVNAFPAKYAYAYGTTFFASVTFRFN